MIKRIPIKVETKEDIVMCAKDIHTESIVPMFLTSSVTGDGIDQLKEFLNLVGKREKNETKPSDPVEYHIDSTFYVEGFGTVIGGYLRSGTINVNDLLYLGPNNGKYEHVKIRSIERNRVRVQEAGSGTYITLALKIIGKEKLIIRKGNVILSPKADHIARSEFVADITVLRTHSTTIRLGYEPILHTSGIRQSAKLIRIEDKKNARNPTKVQDDNILRNGDRARATFQFVHQPEYIKKGFRIVLCEGKCKVVGLVL